MTQKIAGTAVVDALNWRYAVKVFDASKKVSDDDLHAILECGRLSVSENGFEPWQFIVVEDPATRAKLRAVGYDQPKITDASHLIVLARRIYPAARHIEERLSRAAAAEGKDPETLTEYRVYLKGALGGKDAAAIDAWAAKQTMIALGTMVAAASMMGIDNGPMSGFDPAAVDEILGLREQGLAATAFLTLGYRGEDPAASHPKIRRSFEDAVVFMK